MPVSNTVLKSGGEQLLSYYNANPNATKEWPAYKLREVADNMRRKEASINRGLDEHKRLDKKWGNGYDSGETVGAKARAKEFGASRDKLASHLKAVMNSSNSFPSSKEYAEKTLKRLTGRR